MEQDDLVKMLLARDAKLKLKRGDRLVEWRDIARLLLPRSGRFLTDNDARTDRKASYNAIIDDTATFAHKTQQSGMFAGMSSPAQPWFRMLTVGPELLEFEVVKVWLADVSKLIMAVFARSNFYKCMHSMYGELGAFGVGVVMIQDDDETVIHCRALTVGEYCLATDELGRVCTVYRDVSMTVSQIVRKFGIDNVGDAIKALYNNKQLDEDRTILHVVEPREDRNHERIDNKNMPWASYYIDRMSNTLLSESGFHEFPALAPRWDAVGDDVYGEGLGVMCLGNIKQLQHEQLAKGEAIDRMINPPLRAPTSMKNQLNNYPRGITYTDSINAKDSIGPLSQPTIGLSELTADIADVRMRINKTFHSDLFLMLTNDPRTGRTATEIVERHAEKMLILGPVIENIIGEALAPAIDITFNRLMRAGALPPIPEQLTEQGAELKIDFISVLAQAQRKTAANGMDDTLEMVARLMTIKQDVVDKLDADQMVDAYANAVGVDPRVIVDDERVAAIRQARADAQAQAQQQAQAAQAIQAAQALGSTPTDGKTALTDLMGAGGG